MSNVSSSIGHYKCPQLRFPEYNQDWQYHHLQDCAYFLRERSEISKSKFVSTENMLQNCEGIEPYTDNNLVSGIKFTENDILLANIRPYLKKLWKATFNGVCSADVVAFHPHSISADFLYYILSNDKFFTYVMSGVKGSKMPRGDKQHIMAYEFFIPTTSEQNKISKFLDLLTLKIRKQQELLTALKSYKRGLLRCVYSNIIDDWKEYKLSDIAKIYQPQTIASTALIKDGAYPVYGANGCIGRYDRYNHDTEQIAICCRGASCGTVNYIPAFSWITGNAMVINIHSNIADKIFVYYCLLATDLSYMVSGSGQPQIVREPCANHKIHLPNMQTQHHIAELFSTLDKNIDAHIRTLQNLEAIKQALLQNLFI